MDSLIILWDSQMETTHNYIPNNVNFNYLDESNINFNNPNESFEKIGNGKIKNKKFIIRKQNKNSNK